MSYVPRELVPLRFRIARAKDSTVVLGLSIILVLLYSVSLGLYLYYAGKSVGSLTPADLMKIFGIDGNGLAVGILMFSLAVEGYSQKTYVDTYLTKARNLPEYKDKEEEEIRNILKNFHGILKITTSNILKTNVGATLVALSTIVKFIGDFVGG